jgi:outer membrane protein TolC
LLAVETDYHVPFRLYCVSNKLFWKGFSYSPIGRVPQSISRRRKRTMMQTNKRIPLAGRGWCFSYLILAGCLTFSGVGTGQSFPASIATPLPQLPTAPSFLLKEQSSPIDEGKIGNLHLEGASSAVALPVATLQPVMTAGGARIITLQEAQQKAAPEGGNPMARLGQLQVEVARQARLGTLSSFFPQIGSTFTNFHFNKFMGQELQIVYQNFGVPLVGKDQTLLAVTATQPITPLFQLRQLYKINLADERIARVKAGRSVSETSSKVEKAYYELLVAQRQLDYARAKATETGNKWLSASTSAAPAVSDSQNEELIETSNAMAVATTKVEEMTAALDDLLGWPPDTKLQLVAPDPRFENVSLREATDRALAANPEVIEAEQTLVKARAASKIQKLAYVPVVAATGGYAYNDYAVPLLPQDFSFIGVMATYNVFDFGKREHTIKKANAQVEMAEIALQLAKAKVSASVRKSVLELSRSRQMSELTRRLDSAVQLRQASYEGNSSETIAAKKAKVEAEMYQADLDYRRALANLKTLMGEKNE